jgi:hypothetical protein
VDEMVKPEKYKPGNKKKGERGFGKKDKALVFQSFKRRRGNLSN